jgi:uncharacterized membrane protein YfcA
VPPRERHVIVALVALGVLIGLTLGSLGAGGSILAVPVLVHIAGLPAATATATSLVAVGSAAVLGASGHRRNLRLDVAVWFIPTGLIGAIIGAQVGEHLGADALLLTFSALMLVAAYRMFGVERTVPHSISAAANRRIALRARNIELAPGHPELPPTGRRSTRALGVAASGTAVGFLTGLFGVGGGFVIVPALILAVGLAMPEAIATSLLIVAANAFIALVVRGVEAVDWPIAVALTAPMLIGSLLGVRIGSRVTSEHAAHVFALLLVVVALLNAVAVIV